MPLYYIPVDFWGEAGNTSIINSTSPQKIRDICILALVCMRNTRPFLPLPPFPLPLLYILETIMPVARIGTAARRNGRPCDPLLDDEDRKNHDERFPEVPQAEDIPPPPGILLAVGVRKWYQLCEILKPKLLLSPDFYPALENICRAYDRLVMIEGKLEQEGEVIYKSKKIGKDARGGDVWEKVPDKAHPLNREWTLLWSAIRAGLSDFGLTPASARATNIRPNPPQGSDEKPGDGVAARDRTAPVPVEDDE